MKYQSYYPYFLHTHFDSPLWRFMEDEKNSELVKEICMERVNPKFKRWSIIETATSVDMLNSIKYDIPFDFKDWEICVSGIFLLVDRILETVVKRVQEFNFDVDILIRILLGTMLHEYYSTWEYWEKLRDRLDKEYEEKEKGGEFSFNVAHEWTNLIAFYMEEVWWANHIKHHAIIANYYKKALKEKELPLTEKEFEASAFTWIATPHTYKFNKEWLDLMKHHFSKEPDIVKWFRQTRIKRLFHSNVKPILTSIVSAIYHPEELFIVIDPYFFEIEICDRKNLKCHTDHIHFVMSLTNILHSFFCEHCIKKNFSEHELDFSKEITEEETVKKMFDEVQWMLSGVCPDELSINVKWKVKDNNKYEKVKEKITHGNVGFDRYGGENKWITFNVKKDLKGYKKKVK